MMALVVSGIAKLTPTPTTAVLPITTRARLCGLRYLLNRHSECTPLGRAGLREIVVGPAACEGIRQLAPPQVTQHHVDTGLVGHIHVSRGRGQATTDYLATSVRIGWLATH